MKYAVQQCVNGNFSVIAEYPNDNIVGAIVKWHQTCASLWNTPEVITGKVEVVNEMLQVVMNKSEEIKHEQTSEEEKEG